MKKEDRYEKLLKRAGMRRTMVLCATENRPIYCPQTLEEKTLADKVDYYMMKALHAQQKLSQYRIRVTMEQTIRFAMWMWFK